LHWERSFIGVAMVGPEHQAAARVPCERKNALAVCLHQALNVTNGSACEARQQIGDQREPVLAQLETVRLTQQLFQLL
jgi:hypothetical protein